MAFLKESHVVATENIADSSLALFLEEVSHQSLTWGMNLRSAKVIFSLSKKLWTENTLRVDFVGYIVIDVNG
jgi:hypothetical protein